MKQKYLQYLHLMYSAGTFRTDVLHTQKGCTTPHWAGMAPTPLK